MSRNQKIIDTVDEIYVSAEMINHLNSIRNSYREQQKRFLGNERLYNECSDKINSLWQAIEILEALKDIAD